VPGHQEERALNNDESNRTSRRKVLQGGLTVLAAGTAMAAVATQARAQEKLAQNLVQYQDTPKDGAQCDACINWVAPNACKIVEGKIAAKGWCVAFAPKM
jgi:valyl-tRNA synthetase